MTTIAKRPPSDGWVGIRKRRRAFCEAFVREHHPGMVSDKLPKECRPLVPLDGPAIHYDISTSHWWLETNNSMSALGGTYIGYLFTHRNLLDHAWIIGRDDQEPWAVVSEPYWGRGDQEDLKQLREDLEKVGVELIEYPHEQSTHYPSGGIYVLVANIVHHEALMGAVARHIAGRCELSLRIAEQVAFERITDRKQGTHSITPAIN